jgi:hypothetical protein
MLTLTLPAVGAKRRPLKILQVYYQELATSSGYMATVSNPMGQQIADRYSPINRKWTYCPFPSHAWAYTSIRHLWTYQRHVEMSGTQSYCEMYHLQRQLWSSWARYSSEDVTSHKTHCDQVSPLSQQSWLRPDPDPKSRYQKPIAGIFTKALPRG